jgi:Zn-dependent peptidase ImmA (M78 family)
VSREEKIANLVLQANNLIPPYDLIELAKTKAKISFKPFPFKADGITVNIKSNEPKIYINSLVLSNARKNFTIAHELGHIFLPWHKGTIVSIEDYSISEHSLYRTMEAEANRFASELLMPSEWIKKILVSNLSFERKLSKIIYEAKVSLEAALIKIENLCSERRYILKFDQNNICIKETVGLSARKLGFTGKKFDKNSINGLAFYEEFYEKGFLIVTFLLQHENLLEFDTVDSRTWRQILDQILDDTGTQNTKQSINAIVPTRVAQLKKEGVTDIKFICAEVKLHFNHRAHLKNVITHDLFPIYIRKRVDDLMTR